MQRARINARKKKRLADQNLATNLTASSSAIVSDLFPAPRACQPFSSISCIVLFEQYWWRYCVSHKIEVHLWFQAKLLFYLKREVHFVHSSPSKAAEKTPTRKPFRYGSTVYFDQIIQETFCPYGSAYGLSSRYVTKIPVELIVLQELCDLRISLDRASDIACINRWIRLLTESIDLPPSRFGIRSSKRAK